ncbi:hypothetical protein M378DRAFT_569557 [Amanita muscaria Koide BX008]|uniref:Uncharacterized protein n=1 Tax=Amanita muscaria (strain Koide BX008) TaxID=946122 RepID=A0A0C2SP33_AMAMK|nr:hypothetical protein M378DRAFT_569557 [Amanita muscaria Koide BX008]
MILNLYHTINAPYADMPEIPGESKLPLERHEFPRLGFLAESSFSLEVRTPGSKPEINRLDPSAAE